MHVVWLTKIRTPPSTVEYMEYGSLHDLLSNETMHLSGEIILQVARDVAQGLRFLHSSKPPIMHGDLKGRNILIDSRFRAKLCDFGLSTKKVNLITGTPFWLAPEYLRGQTGYTTQCDIYSVAIVLYEMYAREDPYKGEDFRDTLRKVCDRRVNKRPVIPASCPSKMADLMKKCWSPDPFFRPQAKDLDTTLLDMNMRDCEPIDVDEQNMRKERPTGDMLYDLFPKHVADQLKAGQKVEPESHDEVSKYTKKRGYVVEMGIQRDSSILHFPRLHSHCLFGYRSFHGYFEDLDASESFSDVGSFVLGL